MRLLCSLVSGLLIVLMPCFAVAKSNPTLTIFNWQHYLSDHVIALWEQETGVTIKQLYFDSDIKRDRIINQLTRNDLDIAILDEVSARNFSRQHRLHKLSDSALIPNQSNIPELWRNQCGEYAVPYFWGTIGLIYRKDMFPEPPTSWNEILSPKPEHQGHLAMQGDYIDLLLPSLFVRGVSAHTTNQAVLKEVYQELLAQVPYVATYEYLLTYIEKDPSRASNIHLAAGYSGDEVTLQSFTPDYEWGFNVPDEGTILWVDCLAILNDAPNPELAARFLNFLHRPDIAALNALDLSMTTTNDQAHQHIPPYEKQYLALYPDQSLLDKAQFYSTLINTSMTLRNRISHAVIQHHRQLTDND
ncbi:spermidine/putrescine ABC transporter substrate-binding protein [Vibrio sp. D404a]|uniref:ABC transporter substrate-binding protein n=1 Tax=unclassified Vibrio TaxID=2614977 RepID=UPI0025563B91|nr:MULTISPECIES: spermidine/putrescine ABC transporter substrate-binding protein [unclassified Vibrio]MDK9737456.1 spermidine/putrescine ABC transporter substrate-binding protein [Vibrio sp. D404a]MDK9797399.1 spermidine/putrescine ABC transporter substrate-binding protein [Vibrio sp. D449a]